MQVKKIIEKRRSIRKYQDKQVSEKMIQELLEAARQAPSAYNAQPWKFKIINDKETVEKLKQEKIFKNEFVYTAPVIIVCCADEEAYPEKARKNFNTRELAIVDSGIVGQNLVLRATELGLGSCYVGIINRKKIKEILNILGDYIIPFVITIGYADEKPEAQPRKSMEEIVF
jgi:nitroreductase